MSIVDFRRMDADAVLTADLCVVGSGPAGISIAAQFLGSDTRVLIVESGGLKRDAECDALNEFDSVGAGRSAHQMVRMRGFGGTSALWTGRCGIFDEIDYLRRPWLKISGWPIGHDDIAKYSDRAGKYLGLGPALYSSQLSYLLRQSMDDAAWDPRWLLPTIWQFSRKGASESALPAIAERDHDTIPALQHTGAPQSRHLGRSFFKDFEQSDNINVLLNATATSVEVNKEGSRVHSIIVKSLNGKVGRVDATRVVLACGGIDNARLLLASNTVQSCGVGNGRGTVGRFLADHTFAEIGTYQGKGSESFRARLGNRWLDRHGERHVYQVGVRLSPELQRREGLLNCSVHLLSRGEKQHPITLVGDVLREAKRGSVRPHDLLNLARAAGQPSSLAKGIHDRFVLRQPSLSRPSEVAFGCVVEQELNPDSRITLAEKQDALGVPLPKIDWRISDLEYLTARRMSDVVFAEMARLAYALPQKADWCDLGADALRSRLLDLAHPMCTTRMSEDPSTGVVDANCKVHGIENLYVAGSSVFGTPGHMNPTLMIVALSIRLAEHIKAEMKAARSIVLSGPVSHANVKDPRSVRIGIVGAGNRISSIYIPAIRALSNEFEVVGVVSRTKTSASNLATEIGSEAFASVEDLMNNSRPDFLISAVSNHAVDQTLSHLTNLSIPILFETPFAGDLWHGRKILKRIHKNGSVIGVAEQTPFLPEEQFKRKLIDLGLFGRVVAAENSFAAYDYHGIAAARQYLTGGAKLTSVSATRTRLPSPLQTSYPPRDEVWTLATLTYDDGTTLAHRYSDAYFDSPVRAPRAMRFFGTLGTMDGSDVKAMSSDGHMFKASIQRHSTDERLQSLSLRTPTELFTWTNPFASQALSDEQIAVATLVRNMADSTLNGGCPAYPASTALEDIEVMTAIRYSAESNGAPVRMPLGASARLRRIPGQIGTKVKKRFNIERLTSIAPSRREKFASDRE